MFVHSAPCTYANSLTIFNPLHTSTEPRPPEYIPSHRPTILSQRSASDQNDSCSQPLSILYRADYITDFSQIFYPQNPVFFLMYGVIIKFVVILILLRKSQALGNDSEILRTL